VKVKMTSGSAVDKVKSYTGVSISGLIGVCLILASCGDYRTSEKCSDTIKAGDKGSFVTDPSGLARDTNTGTVWYRCPGGKTFSNFRCKGETLFVSWDDATAYAVEFSKKSGVKWRLPTNSEMKSIVESSCIAPVINENVFPATEVTNHWTSSDGWHQKAFKCALNTYNGSLSCRQARIIEQPFLLVQDRG
jgi:hypothetical protein